MTRRAPIMPPTDVSPKRRLTRTSQSLSPLPRRTTHETYLAHPALAPRPDVRLLRDEAASGVADQPQPDGEGGQRPAPDCEAHGRAAGSYQRLRAHCPLCEGFRLRPEVECGHRRPVEEGRDAGRAHRPRTGRAAPAAGGPGRAG